MLGLSDGPVVGEMVGLDDGDCVVGLLLGDLLGLSDGPIVGEMVGLEDGASVGDVEGLFVGFADEVGDEVVGLDDGDCVVGLIDGGGVGGGGI